MKMPSIRSVAAIISASSGRIVAVIAAAFCVAAAPMAARAEAKEARLVCSGYTGSTALENFQALIRLSDDDGYGFSYSEAGGSSATNIWFTSADGATVYPHEIDTWDVTGDSFVWVCIPVLTNGADVVMHWSDAASDVETTSDSVWDGFVGVWHMNETGTASEPDSTGNGLSATPLYNTTTSTSANTADGQVGAGRSIAQGAHLKVASHSGKITTASIFTVGAWVKRTSSGSFPRIFAGNPGTDNSVRTYWETYLQSDTELRARGGSSELQGCSVSLGTSSGWKYLTIVFNGTTATVYQNGTLVKSGSTETSKQGDFFTIGGIYSRTDRSFVGVFDEARMYDGVLSADRVAADYATMNSPTTFFVAVSDDTIVTATWTGNAGDGDVSNAGNWTCRNGSGSVVSDGLPGAATAVTVSGDSLDFQVPASATLNYATLTIGDCTLAKSCDWTGLGNVEVASGATIDLKGHALFVQGLTGAGVVTNTANATYTTLDYIQADNSDASQYIITDYTPRYSDTFVTKVNFQNTVCQCIYCARGGSVGSGSYTCITYGVGDPLRFDHVATMGSITSTPTPPIGADAAFTINGKTGVCKLNGESIYTMATPSDDTATAASVLSFFLLNNSASGTAMSSYGQANFKMYYFRIYDVDGAVVRDYVPAKNGSGVAGLWERVNNVFWPSGGGTAFAAGSETSRGEVVFCGTGTWSGVEIAPAVTVVKDLDATLTRSGELTPGMSGTGTASFGFNDGTVALGSYIAAGAAEFNVYGGTVNATSAIDWGKRAGETATWNQYGGTVSQSGGNFWIGAYGANGAVGIYNLYGGTLTKSGNAFTLGQEANHTGYFTMTNGTFTSSADVYVGGKGVGRFTASGGTLNANASLKVANVGTGAFVQSGAATVSVGSYLQIGAEAGSTGTYTMTGGTLGVPNYALSIGRYGTGTLNVSDTAVVTASLGVRVGFSSNGIGTLNVTDGGTVVTTSIYGGGDTDAQATVLFDGATVRATASGNIIKDIANVTICSDGLTLDTTSSNYTLAISGSTVKVTPGDTPSITLAGGGTLDLSGATIGLTARPTAAFDLVVTADGDAATFSGTPTLADVDGVSVKGWQVRAVDGGTRLRVCRKGVMMIVY